MDKIIKVGIYLQEFNGASIVLRLFLATFFGGIIGIEREVRGRTAGFRTFTLVALSACLGTVVNLYLYDITGNTDVARIPAGIVSGIGFLGMGTIIVTKRNHVRGLTTAAGLWATAALGISLGSGLIWVSAIAFILVLFTISTMQNLSHYLARHSRQITLYVEMARETDVNGFLSYIKEQGFSISSMDKKREKRTKDCEIEINIRINLTKKCDHQHIISDLSKIEGVCYIEEVYN